MSESDRYGFDIKKQVCLSCNLVQSNPRPSQEFHKEFYKSHYRKLYTSTNSVNYGSIAMKAESIIKGKLVIDTFQQIGITDLQTYNIIDIGCSHGGLIKYLEPFVKSVSGYDLDKDAIEYGKNNLKLNINIGERPTASLPGKNIYVLSHVLEHVFDPLEFIVNIKRVLKDIDYLYISVPGMNMVKEGSYSNDLRSYFHLAHVSDFTKETLSNLLGVAGFKSILINETIDGIFQINPEGCQPFIKPTGNIIKEILEIVKSKKNWKL